MIVVFPAPRYPVITVTGTMRASLAASLPSAETPPPRFRRAPPPSAPPDAPAGPLTALSSMATLASWSFVRALESAGGGGMQSSSLRGGGARV